MSDWDNQKALLNAIRDWQRQQQLYRDPWVQRSLLEDARSQSQLYARVIDDMRSQVSLYEEFTKSARLQSAFLDEVRGNFAAFDAVKRSISAMASPPQFTSFRSLVDDVTAARHALVEHSGSAINPLLTAPWDVTRSQMEAALRFLPPLEADPPPEWRSALERIAREVAAAPLLGHVLVEDEVDGEASERPSEEVVGTQLIEVVPAGALADLEAVSFAPLRLLEQAVRDPSFLLRLESREFEEVTAALVEQLGIEDVTLTPPKSDGGRDVLGKIRTAGLDIVVAFECKRYAHHNAVGVETARALLGTITHNNYRADRGVLVTTSRFTKGATDFILTTPQLRGVDYKKLKEWLAQVAQGRRGSATS